MFILFISFLTAIAVVGLYWTLGRCLSYFGLNMNNRKMRLTRAVAAVISPFVYIALPLFGLIMMHFIAIFAATQLVNAILCKLLKEGRAKTVCARIETLARSGALAALITLVFMIYGAVNMSRAVVTEYTVESDKLNSDYDIVLITDTHYGTIQDTELLKSKISEINELEPDAVILGGDIVERNTSKEDMQEVFDVLGDIESTYGTYYVYGNHDRQDYGEARTYTDEELEDAIESNGITILEDNTALIGDEILLVGRQDAAYPDGRAEITELLKDADKSKFIIVADHQPLEASENASNGVDLEISGHTHSGQIFPLGYLFRLAGILTYGEYHEDQCTVIVSSVFAGWGFPIRTQAHCEYVVIHIQ